MAQEGSRGGRTPRTFRGYGRRDRPAAEEGLRGPSSSSLFRGLFLDSKPQARAIGMLEGSPAKQKQPKILGLARVLSGRLRNTTALHDRYLLLTREGTLSIERYKYEMPCDMLVDQQFTFKHYLHDLQTSIPLNTPWNLPGNGLTDHLPYPENIQELSELLPILWQQIPRRTLRT
ncbi:hypothetical protein GEV33_008129 [Tenebrio molitor]|uniref:Uncharacterized protein n=1 Tax=Tenebrio molitor TaxID=7067 RepID=A0A8J6HHX4_TENMO|nr:hypothetical protein GEV33_008129 [Tenebrio molitor]